MSDYISALDTERFGFKIAKFSNNIENPEVLVQKLEHEATKLIIVRLDSSNLKLINQLEDIGFRYKDAQVTFSYNIKEVLPLRPVTPGFSIVPFRPEHLADLVGITRDSFNNYGHYFADDKLDKEKCGEIYSDWIYRCSINKDVADEIIVAERNGIAIGYLAVKVFRTQGEVFVAGVIGAVSKEYRKLGVFQAINIESISICKKLGGTRIENNVLVTNFPVIGAYTALNYKIIRSELTMHYWYDK